jgi:DNA gyrase subunit B
VEIQLIDQREQTERGFKTRDYKYDGGIVDFVRYLNEAKSVLFEEPLYISGEKDGVLLELAMQYTDGYTESIFSYVNNIPTIEGGAHETGFKIALTKVFNEWGRKFGFIKEKEPNFIGEDFREGLTAVLSVKMQNVQFEGQTKTKLGNTEAKMAVEGIMAADLQEFLENEAVNRPIIDLILGKAQTAARVREAARKAKEITRQKNSIDNATLVGKLSSCTGKKPENNELYIVEGDSAGGSAKQARDRSFQAILPLRGKPLNAERKRLDQVLANEEIRTIISALGTSIGEDFSLDDLKYYKIIILSDADQDGAHIRAILLTFFFRYMKDLITEGNVYIGLPPLYKVYKKDLIKYAFNDDDLDATIKEVGRGYAIQRYKGLGEMNPEQLWDTTMNPASRTLMQVTLEDAADAEKIITTLMGDNIDARKEYLSEWANFNKEDKLLNEFV